MYKVYAIYSKKFNKIYIGQTIDLEKRILDHNSGLSGYTKKFIPWETVYVEEYSTRTEVLQREKQLKTQKGREFIWKLIQDRESI